MRIIRNNPSRPYKSAAPASDRGVGAVREPDVTTARSGLAGILAKRFEGSLNAVGMDQSLVGDRGEPAQFADRFFGSRGGLVRRGDGRPRMVEFDQTGSEGRVGPGFAGAAGRRFDVRARSQSLAALLF